MNNFLLYIGGLLIAALMALFAIPHFVDWNAYRGVFEEEASRILGRELRVGGSVNVRFLPAPYVSFEKVRIADEAADASSIIRIDSFTMWLSVPPLLRGVLEANQVEVRRPVIQLAIDRSGSGNWRTLTINPGAMPLVPKDVALQSVRIVDGAVIVSGPAKNELARLADITGELTAEALDGPYKFKGSLKWEGDLRDVRFATARQDPNGDVRFKAAVDAPASGNSYLLDGRVSDLRGQPKLEGELTAKLKFHLQSDNVEDTVEGAALLPRSAKELPTATPAAPDTRKAEFDLRAKVTGDATGVELGDLSATLDTGGGIPQLVAGRARLAWSEKFRLDLALDSRLLDLDRLAGESLRKVPFQAARGFFDAIAAALPEGADTNATLDLDQLTLGGEPISDVHFAASRSGGPLKIKGVRASLPGGARLQLEGVLVPDSEEPRIEGAVFVTGQSLLRFLGWGFGAPHIGEGRTDGPFALDGQFVLGERQIELSNATAEVLETPITGSVKLSLGKRKRLAVSLEGTRVDAAQIRSGVLGLNTLHSLFLGGNAFPGESATHKASHAGNMDLSLKLRLAEFADGDRILRDLDLDIGIEEGTLSIPRLNFATPDGLAVDAEGIVKNAVERPEGTINALIVAPNETSAKTFVRILDLTESDQKSLERLGRLAPMRVAVTLTLKGRAKASHLAVDGNMGGGRVMAAIDIENGYGDWRSVSTDVTATIASPDVARLVSALFDLPPAVVPLETAQPGQFFLRASGIPASGLLARAEISADTFSLDYDGRLTLPGQGRAAASGKVRISSSDARGVLSLAGLKLGEGAAGVPLSAVVSLDLEDDTMRLGTDAMTLGASSANGTLSLKHADGRSEVTADIVIDAASFAQLLAPILARAPEDAASESQPPQHRENRQAQPSQQPAATPAPKLWPEQIFDLSALDQVSGTVRAQIGALALEPGLTISDAKLHATFGPHGITVTKLEGTAVGGKLTSKLDFEKARAGVGLKGSLRIDIASTREKSSIVGADAPGDVAALALEFAGRALSPAALVSSLSGKGTLTAGDATLTGMSPASIASVAEAALTGKGPASGELLAQAVKAAAKEGEIKLGKIEIPVTIADGALKLDKVTIESPEGRSTFTSVIDLATMRLDSEWQIEPRLARLSAAAKDRPFLPPVTVVYAGKLSALSSLEPMVSTDSLERELSVRKMERAVDELERLRKQDQIRLQQERERRKAIEEDSPSSANTATPVGPAPSPAPSASLPGAQASEARDPVEREDPPPVAPEAENGTKEPGTTSAAAGGAGNGSGSGSRSVKKRKPSYEAWGPFQNSPWAPF